MKKKTNKEIIDVLAQMVTDANRRAEKLDSHAGAFGKCTWVDVDNNDRCNDHWSEFQCAQVSGTFYPGEICDSSDKA